ncbi:MAG: host attachment protein [Alphaproteobacteria bacterium]|nr:host attachment protein [Alphaproteobacteria bacterium]
MSGKATWVVVADAAGARIFALNGPRQSISLKAVRDLSADIKPSRKIASDRPGRTHDRLGPGRHAEEPPTDPKRHAKFSFAREIAHILDDERRKNAFAKLHVVAPPQFLGDLRGVMGSELRALVGTEINKDLTRLSVHELTPQLQDLLFA